MTVYDISWPISVATTGYKDRHVVSFEETKTMDADGVRESIIRLSTHTGTHIDAPSHFLRDGKTIDEITPERLIGDCVVLDFTHVAEKITRFDLQEYTIEPGMIVLLKTTNSAQSPTNKFSPHFIYLDASGAEYLAQKKVKAVGIDYLGIERSQTDHVTHTTLMHADVIVIEGLRLQNVPGGEYFLVCLPLNLIGLEAAPARAVLIEPSLLEVL